MTKQNVAEPESLGEAMNRTELFFEKNGRKLTYVFLGLLVLAALGLRLPGADRGAARREGRGDDRRGAVAFRGGESRLRAGVAGRCQRRRVPRRDRAVRFDPLGQSGQALRRHLLPAYGRSGECRRLSGEVFACQGICPAHSSMPRTTGCRATWPSSGRTTPRPWISTSKAVKAADNNLTAPMYLRKAGLAAQAQGDDCGRRRILPADSRPRIPLRWRPARPRSSSEALNKECGDDGDQKPQPFQIRFAAAVGCGHAVRNRRGRVEPGGDGGVCWKVPCARCAPPDAPT